MQGTGAGRACATALRAFTASALHGRPHAAASSSTGTAGCSAARRVELVPDPFRSSGGRGVALEPGLFAREKLLLLGKDKSAKGSWDEPILDILERLNAHPDFCTLSSCSGRAFLWRWSVSSAPSLQAHARRAEEEECPAPTDFFWPSKKLGQQAFAPLWRFHVCHDFPQFRLEEALAEYAAQHGRASCDGESQAGSGGLAEGAGGLRSGMVWLKYEPLICHIACRSWEAAANLMDASNIAFPSTSLRSWRKRFVVQVRGEDQMEMPVAVLDGNSARPMPDVVSLDFIQNTIVRQKFDRNSMRTDAWRKTLQQVGL